MSDPLIARCPHEDCDRQFIAVDIETIATHYDREHMILSAGEDEVIRLVKKLLVVQTARTAEDESLRSERSG